MAELSHLHHTTLYRCVRLSLLIKVTSFFLKFWHRKTKVSLVYMFYAHYTQRCAIRTIVFYAKWMTDK